jgi:hypothetical protein
MSNHGKAYLSATCGEENVFVDKETINHQFNILMELDKLLGSFANTLSNKLAVPPHSVPLHSEN